MTVSELTKILKGILDQLDHISDDAEVRLTDRDGSVISLRTTKELYITCLASGSSIPQFEIVIY
jgi:hypothetical protein